LAVGSPLVAVGLPKATAVTEILKKSKKYIDNGLMILENDHLRLTKEGNLLADGIAADLFLDQ
jgi:oxygen-independent coproporphyrinogen-3 oxidase